jgi:hypothetical protein
MLNGFMEVAIWDRNTPFGEQEHGDRRSSWRAGAPQPATCSIAHLSRILFELFVQYCFFLDFTKSHPLIILYNCYYFHFLN